MQFFVIRREWIDSEKEILRSFLNQGKQIVQENGSFQGPVRNH
jgi:hypothetical protein